MKNMEEGVEVEKTSNDVQQKREAWFNSTSSLPRPLGLVRNKIDA
jgi:hypothetical protein